MIANKLYLDELESEVQSLRKENHKLKMTIEQNKIQYYETLNKDFEDKVIMLKKLK